MLNEGDVSAPSASQNELFISDCFCLVFGDSSMDQTHIKHKKEKHPPELQSSPAKPSWQTQKPSLQSPFLLQLLAQYTSEQSSPT